MIDHLDHVAIFVQDVEQALPYFVDTLGLTVVSEEQVPAAGVRLTYLDAGNTFIQLVEPTDAGPLMDALNSRGEGLHHVCFAVADIHAAVNQLAPDGDVKVIIGGRGRHAAFLPPGPNGIVTELTELLPAAVPGGA